MFVRNAKLNKLEMTKKEKNELKKLLTIQSKQLLKNGFELIDSGLMGDDLEDHLIAMMVAEYCKDGEGKIQPDEVEATLEYFKRIDNGKYS